MKKILLFAVAATLLSAPAVFSQLPVTKLTVDEKGMKKKIEKSDEDIANPKKNEKVNTWLNRADLFYQAEVAVTGYVWDGMKLTEANERFGEPTSSEQVEIEVRQGVKEPFTKYHYEYIDLYVNDQNVVRAWELKLVLDQDALGKSIDAYKRSYELDTQKKNAEKIGTGLQNCFDILQKKGSQSYFFRNYQAAGDYFAKAIDLAQFPGFTSEERRQNLPIMAHDTGISYLNAQNYEKTLEFLYKAEELGYHQDGEIYCLIYHAYKQMDPKNEKGQLVKAKEALEKGFSKYPGYSRIVESLTDVYVILGEDLNSIVPIIRSSLDKEPDNAILWNGLGIIYEKTGNVDQSLEAFQKMAALRPDDFGANYSIGVLLVRKADDIKDDLYRSNPSGQAEYDAHYKRMLTAYAAAVPWLEKAYDHVPADNQQALASTVELLKNITYVVRDTDSAMMKKYEKYKALFDTL